jgi:hypothetical protein
MNGACESRPGIEEDRGGARDARGILGRMKVKARDGKVYEVGTAPPGGRHEVKLDGKAIGAFVLDPDETRVMDLKKGATEELLVDIADRFVAQGGAPMGIA